MHDIEVVSDWQPTHEEAGKICFVKNVRGWIGKLQLMAEPEMSLKIYADVWDVDYLFVLFALAASFILVGVIALSFLQLISMKHTPDFDSDSNRVEPANNSNDEEENIPAEVTVGCFSTFKKLAGMFFGTAMTWFDLYSDIMYQRTVPFVNKPLKRL